MDKSEELWPRRGEGFPANNVWYEGADKFVALLSTNRMMWTRDMDLKYLNVRIDTRSGHFVLSVDGDERVEIERVLKALADANDRFGARNDSTPTVTSTEPTQPYPTHAYRPDRP